jgi:hypothetical protein
MLSSTNLTSQVQFSDYPAGNEIALSTFPDRPGRYAMQVRGVVITR